MYLNHNSFSAGKLRWYTFFQICVVWCLKYIITICIVHSKLKRCRPIFYTVPVGDFAWKIVHSLAEELGFVGFSASFLSWSDLFLTFFFTHFRQALWLYALWLYAVCAQVAHGLHTLSTNITLKLTHTLTSAAVSDLYDEYTSAGQGESEL